MATFKGLQVYCDVCGYHKYKHLGGQRLCPKPSVEEQDRICRELEAKEAREYNLLPSSLLERIEAIELRLQQLEERPQ
jgi:hypothetical protein